MELGFLCFVRLPNMFLFLILLLLELLQFLFGFTVLLWLLCLLVNLLLNLLYDAFLFPLNIVELMFDLLDLALHGFVLSIQLLLLLLQFGFLLLIISNQFIDAFDDLVIIAELLKLDVVCPEVSTIIFGRIIATFSPSSSTFSSKAPQCPSIDLLELILIIFNLFSELNVFFTHPFQLFLCSWAIRFHWLFRGVNVVSVIGILNHI